MDLPDGYFYSNGFVWGKDGSGPYGVNSGGAITGLGVSPSSWPGTLSQFNRMAGGMICVSSAEIAADAAVYSGPCIFVGVKVIAAGTSVIVYDNTVASGTRIINGEATTAVGTILTGFGPGVGVQMSTGIYLDLTGGTYVVGYIPTA